MKKTYACEYLLNGVACGKPASGVTNGRYRFCEDCSHAFADRATGRVKRIMLTKRKIEDINAEYAHVCMRLGDAYARKAIADLEIRDLGVQIVKLNDEAMAAKKEQA